MREVAEYAESCEICGKLQNMQNMREVAENCEICGKLRNMWKVVKYAKNMRELEKGDSSYITLLGGYLGYY